MPHKLKNCKQKCICSKCLRWCARSNLLRFCLAIDFTCVKAIVESSEVKIYQKSRNAKAKAILWCQLVLFLSRNSPSDIRNIKKWRTSLWRLVTSCVPRVKNVCTPRTFYHPTTPSPSLVFSLTLISRTLPFILANNYQNHAQFLKACPLDLKYLWLGIGND